MQQTVSHYFAHGNSGSSCKMPKRKDTEKESAQNDEVSNKELKELFSDLIQKLESSMNERLTALDKKVEETLIVIKEEITDMKTALQNQDDRLTDLEKLNTEVIQPQSKKVSLLEASLKELQDHITYQELRSRKYNLLFYGIPKAENEVSNEVIVKFLSEKLGMSTAESIMIKNAHRVPKNPNSSYKPEAPEAVIVKFVLMEDRNMILNHARNTTLPKGYAIRTDLPVHLKRKRAELAQKAYELRKSGMKTRIRETKDDVILEYRQKGEKEWLAFSDSL